MKKRLKVTVARGRKIPRSRLRDIRKKAGSSNAGKYPEVSPSEFAGSAGGSSPFSFPINTRKRAKAALSYAHNAPNPNGIKRKVCRKYKGICSKKTLSKVK